MRDQSVTSSRTPEMLRIPLKGYTMAAQRALASFAPLRLNIGDYLMSEKNLLLSFRIPNSEFRIS